MKMRAGLFNRGLPSEFADDFSDQIGHADHRAIAREAVRKSQVLLKNQGGVLPASPQGSSSLLVPAPTILDSRVVAGR